VPRRPASKGAPPAEADVIWIGIKADEYNLSRLAALLTFVRYPGAEKLNEQLDADSAAGRSPMEPDAFDLTAVDDVLDPELARQEIGDLVKEYVGKHGPEMARRLFGEYGATKFSELSPDKYGAVLADLKRSLAKKKTS
jgi:hypothetical protein